MKLPVFFSAILGWWAAAGTMMIGALYLEIGAPNLERSQLQIDWRNGILFNLFWSCFFAVPACLIAGFLVAQYLPVTSPWWRPARTALLGGVCGFLVMGLPVGMVCASQGVFPSDDWWYLSFAAAAGGAVCGLSLARFKQKLLKPEAPPPSP